jgi:hypothetical protein
LATTSIYKQCKFQTQRNLSKRFCSSVPLRVKICHKAFSEISAGKYSILGSEQ